MRGERLRIDPCIPKDWPGFRITYRRRPARSVETCYEIAVENPRRVTRGISRVELDGNALPTSDDIPLVDDGRTHTLRVVLG